MTPDIVANSIVAVSIGAVAGTIEKLEAEPDSGDRRHTVFEELKALNSTCDPRICLHPPTARTTL
jgi:hypothetical protein